MVMSISTAPKGKVTPVGGVPAAMGVKIKEPPTGWSAVMKEEAVVGATVVVVGEVVGCMS